MRFPWQRPPKLDGYPNARLRCVGGPLHDEMVDIGHGAALPITLPDGTRSLYERREFQGQLVLMWVAPSGHQ